MQTIQNILSSAPHVQPIPPGAIIAHYAQTAPGKWAVVTASGAVLGASFYDLRHKYTAVFALLGRGGWVALVPVPQFTQPALF